MDEILHPFTQMKGWLEEDPIKKLSRERYAWEDRMGWKVAYEVRDKGVLIRSIGNVIVIMPLISINAESMERLMDVLRESMIAVT